MRPTPLTLFALLAVLPGCIVIPIGDLLRGPVLEESVLVDGGGFFQREKIAVIDIDGLITGTEKSGLILPQENAVSETKAQLNRAANDPEVKAVVLRVSSPGGEVTACDVIHHEIGRFKQRTGLPVVSFIGDQGASGGYYVAVAGDTIFANPTAIVGSIGVLLHHLDLSDLLGKIGVAVEPVKSAEQKDLNSPFRKMLPAERAVLQKLVDDMYNRFVDAVAAGRPGMTREDVLAVADGRVLSGVEAKKARLVDSVGYLTDALEEAKQRGHIESPTIVRYSRAPRSGANIYTESVTPGPQARELHVSLPLGLGDGPKLYYLWRPGW